MSYKLKTLIVFDTNSLRRTDSGEVVYSSFSFGKPYEIINDYVSKNNLHGDVLLAVSALVIDEIKLQMERSYTKDLQKLKETKRRLSGLPHVTEELIGIPDEEFDCSKFVELKAKEYLEANKNVKLLSYKEEQSSSILTSLISRVHNYRPPFFKTSQNSDAGFKDSVIWETLLNYDEVENFNKIVLVTKDKGFEGCEEEFTSKWNRHFKIVSAPETVNTEIGIDYENYIKNRKVYDYAQKEYFDDYLKDILNSSSSIQYQGGDIKIENYRIESHCENVEMIQDEDGDFNCPVINSKINVYTTFDGKKIEVSLIGKTMLSDLEYMEIEETTFDPEIH